MPWWQQLVVTFLPIVIQIVENATGVTPNPNDSSWVKGLIQEVVSIFQKWIPACMLPEVQVLEQFVVAEVEKLLGIPS